MYIVLLSGGSGKRLWPLSNDLRSKQYIKITREEDSGTNCSMLQRVWKQIEKSKVAKKCIITASQGQVEIIKSQLGDVNIAIEPERRDTFPAVALSCVYIKDYLNAEEDECVCFIPVDPYTEIKYFETLKKLEKTLDETDSDVVLMGVVPTEPSTKYGYIVPKRVDEEEKQEYYEVEKFQEKPTENVAAELIQKHALWNCGVFCMKIKTILSLVEQLNAPITYPELYNDYGKLPKISFDYQVLEKSQNLYVVPFQGMWKDLGTWDILAGQMNTDILGKGICDSSCENTNIVNELDIPTIAVGTKNVMVVASFDGILVIDKEKSNEVKEIVSKLNYPSKYEERRWGVLNTLDLSETEDGFTLLRKIIMFGGASSSYHYHNERDEVLTILSGRGEIIIDGVSILLSQGTTITIPQNKKHAVRAFCDMEYLETHIGRTFGDEDINRLTFDWNEILRMEKKK